MSEAIDLRVSRSLELVAAIKKVIAEFAELEEALTRDLRNRRYAISRRLRDGVDRTTTRLAERTTALENELRDREAAIQRHYDARVARIQSAHHGILRTVRAKAKQEAEKRRAELQMRHFNAERSLPKDLQAADASYADFTQIAAQEGSRLTELERRVWKAFSGFWKYQSLLRKAAPPAEALPDPPPDRDQLLAQTRALLAEAETDLTAYRSIFLARLFSYVPIFAIVPAVVLGALALAYQGGMNASAWTQAGALGAGVIGAVAIAYIVGLQQAKPIAVRLAQSLAGAAKKLKDCGAAAAALHASNRESIQSEYDRTMAEVQRLWNQGADTGDDFEDRARRKTERQLPRAFAKNDSLLRPRLAREQERHAAAIERDKAAAEEARAKLQDRNAAETAELDAEESTRWAELIADWKRHAHPLLAEIDDMNVALAGEFPPWTPKFVEEWTPPTSYLPATKFGCLELDFREGGQTLPQDPRLALPYGPVLSVPLALTYPNQGSLLFETKESADGTLVDVLNSIILRLLTTTPPGKLALTILDPVGLGQSFAGLMHLADYEEGLINRRIWTQREQLEDRLAELGEHIGKGHPDVSPQRFRHHHRIQRAGRQRGGEISFPCHRGFPCRLQRKAPPSACKASSPAVRAAAFTPSSIGTSGSRCPRAFDPDEMRRNSVCLPPERRPFHRSARRRRKVMRSSNSIRPRKRISRSN